MKDAPVNKGLRVEQNKTEPPRLARVRLLSDEAMKGKAAGEIVFVDMATAERLIAGYFAELAEE